MDYIILPLYSWKHGKKTCFPRSSMNQSNARGRVRDLYEVYIPIPYEIRTNYPNFFPEEEFDLFAEDLKFSAKICQQDDKALMTNPNSNLGTWLFEKLGIEKTRPNEVVSYEELAKTGYDSVKIKIIDGKYHISLMPVGSYEKFM